MRAFILSSTTIAPSRACYCEPPRARCHGGSSAGIPLTFNLLNWQRHNAICRLLKSKREQPVGEVFERLAEPVGVYQKSQTGTHTHTHHHDSSSHLRGDDPALLFSFRMFITFLAFDPDRTSTSPLFRPTCALPSVEVPSPRVEGPQDSFASTANTIFASNPRILEEQILG